MATTAGTMAGMSTGAKKLKIKVDARPDPSKPGGVDYDHKDGKGAGGPIKCPKGTGEYEITFDLRDHTDFGLHFDTNNPFLCDVTVGDKCPTTLNAEFKVMSCTSDALVVYDANNNETTYHYQLNINKRDGGACPYDPIIQNGGKTRKPSFVLFVAVAGGIVALVAITYFLGMWGN
jgi:hypothetical protein